MVLIRADELRARLDAAFTAPAPPIDIAVELGHRELGGEQTLWILAVAKQQCPDPVVFYARAIGLTWGDSFVDARGDDFPGRGALSAADLALPGLAQIREDVLSGGSPDPATTDLDGLRERIALFRDRGVEVDLQPFEPVLRAQATLEQWNAERWIWETPTRWCMADWGTSA